MSRRSIVLLVAVLATALTLAVACAAPPATPATPPATGTAAAGAPEVRAPQGTLNLGFPRPSNLSPDPGFALTSESMIASWPVFDGLTVVNDRGVPQPNLARSWSSSDGLTWEFKLRDDISFANGEKFDAESVRFSLDRYTNPDNRLPLATRLGNLAGYSVVDPYTVRFTLKEVDPNFTGLLSQVLMLPPQAFQQAGSPERFFERPIGTGPFTLAQGDPNNGYTLEARGVGTVTPRGLASVKTINIRWIQEASVRQASLLTGELDAAINMPVEIARALEAQGMTIVPNLAGPTVHFVLRQDTGPLADARVRQAANYAVDKQTIINTVLGGFARLDQGQIIGPQAIGFNEQVRAYPYDAPRARQLLTEAGFPNGFSGRMTVIANPLAGPDLGQAVARYLRDVGINVNVEVQEAAVWGRNSNAGTPEQRGEFFVGLASADNAIDAYRFFSSSQNPPSTRRWMNAEFDRLFQQARVTVDDTRRADLFQQAAKILRDEAGALFLWQPVNLGVNRPGVTFEPGYSAFQFVRANKQ